MDIHGRFIPDILTTFIDKGQRESDESQTTSLPSDIV
jgi:hypothetical protein